VGEGKVGLSRTKTPSVVFSTPPRLLGCWAYGPCQQIIYPHVKVIRQRTAWSYARQRRGVMQQRALVGQAGSSPAASIP